jgi:glycosyltransferase involved in cell wall biosynthesis
VHFLGERSDIPQILAQSQIFALTSQREGFPNVLLEAMAASLPVLSTPAGEARTLVKDGENGFLVPMDSPQALADRLVALAQSPTLRKKLGHAGRQMVEAQYGTAGLSNALLAVYLAVARLARSTKAINALHTHVPIRDLPTRPARLG